MDKVLFMFCITIIQKMSTAQAPKLFTVQLEGWSYPYTSCFQVLGLYSSVTLGFLEFQRPSSVHLFLRCAYLPFYYKEALDLKISMQDIYTYTHTKKGALRLQLPQIQGV